MAFDTTLVFNISTRRLVLSAAQPVDAGAPVWVFGDTESLQVQFVKSADSPGAVSIIPTAGVGLQVAIGEPGQTPYNSATAGAAVNDFFPVSLAINTSSLQAALNGKTYIDTTLELKTTSGGQFQRYQIQLRVMQQVAVDALSDPNPPDIAIGRNDALATFVQQDQAPGDYQIWRSPSGLKKAKVFLGDDGTIHADPIS